MLVLTPSKWRLAQICLLLLVLWPVVPGFSRARITDQTIQTNWTTEREVHAVVQPADVYLCLGTLLSRFSGFHSAPVWHQTTWLRLLFIVFALLVMVASYRFHVRQIGKAISVKFDERFAERTRIALELHDTLLQTVQGSKLVADDALERSDDPVNMQRAMKRLSAWLGQAILEAQAALSSLRTATLDPDIEANDLAVSLLRVTQACLIDGSIKIKFSMEGQPRDMYPIARDQLFRIGHEAIRNACEHSSASQLEISLKYGDSLTLLVNDNSIGVEQAILTDSKPAHTGLEEMHQRADRIGAKLSIVSDPTSGTQLTLVVPGENVFRKSSATRRGLDSSL
jgi:signal transduction histidine kinase